jgi:signal transduction histidine kinase
MTDAQPDRTQVNPPFKLVKYLSLSSLVVILVSTVFLSAFISKRAKVILMNKSEQYSLLVAENLNHQVFYQFTLPTLIAEGEVRLSRESQHNRLEKVVQNTIHGFAVEGVNIYDPKQILTYSTDQEKIGTQGNLGALFDKALAGESSSILVKGDNSFKLKTYLPMWVEMPMSWKRGKVLGVFEITLDVTKDYEAIQNFQWIVIAGFSVFVGILYATLFFIARRAERIIAMRAEERIRLEERLHQAERLASLGEMISGVSHEIRNPLGIIRSTSELLQTRVENERQKKLAAIIVEESTRLNGILTEFLDFARPKVPRISECRIEDVLDRNLNVIAPTCAQGGIEIEREYMTTAYTLNADQDLLYRAFVNLFVNAVQAMPEGGRLTVRTNFAPGGKNGPQQVEVRIQDTGPGIPKDLRGKIFNPFFTTREKGTGLGLAIVRSVIDSHHGEIFVESEPGEGTAVVIRLPLEPPERH